MNVQFNAPGIKENFSVPGKASGANVVLSSKSPYAIDIVLTFPNGITRAKARYLLSTRTFQMLKHTNEFKHTPSSHELAERQSTLHSIVTNPLVVQCIHGYFGRVP